MKNKFFIPEGTELRLLIKPFDLEAKGTFSGFTSDTDGNKIDKWAGVKLQNPGETCDLKDEPEEDETALEDENYLDLFEQAF